MTVSLRKRSVLPRASRLSIVLFGLAYGFVMLLLILPRDLLSEGRASAGLAPYDSATMTPPVPGEKAPDMARNHVAANQN
ncbi:hypothetical protein HOY34_10930 [Xinfangfangia sp. D13-10-4-6]|uniref:hypothetical protein n=1 Tax=Pseudogemmobacter hezensis TaxID=2737662 RepID=UPI0015556BD3|nr:hypothetical protein [Pseudogemmobacter hezensis]NPD15716.1 hypothetical protein [Pseudogemmobacter hezensis]